MALKKCKECGHEISTKAETCPNCGEPQSTCIGVQSAYTARILALIGAISLFIGVFMPIVSIPILGNRSYLSLWRGDAIVLICVAFLSLLLVLARSYRFLLLPGCFSLFLIVYTYLRLQRRLNATIEEVKSGLAGNPFAELGISIFESIQIEWGFGFLIVGPVLIITAALAYQTKKDDSDAESTAGQNRVENHSSF